MRPDLTSSAGKALPSFLQSNTVGMIRGGLERHRKAIKSCVLTTMIAGGIWSNSGILEATASKRKKKVKQKRNCKVDHAGFLKDGNALISAHRKIENTNNNSCWGRSHWRTLIATSFYTTRSRWVGACNSHTKPMSRIFYRLILFLV